MIPAVFRRGGTSKAIVPREQDLPRDKDALDGNTALLERLQAIRLAASAAMGIARTREDAIAGSVVDAVTRPGEDPEAPIRIAMPSGGLTVAATVRKSSGEWVAEQGAFYRTQRRLFDGHVYASAARVAGLTH